MKFLGKDTIKIIFFGSFLSLSVLSCKTRNFSEGNTSETSAVTSGNSAGGVNVYSLEGSEIARYTCKDENAAKKFNSMCSARVSINSLGAANAVLNTPGITYNDATALAKALESNNNLQPAGNFKAFSALAALFPVSPTGSNTAMIGKGNSSGGKVQVWTASNPPKGPLAKVEVLAAMREIGALSSPVGKSPYQMEQDRLSCLQNDTPEWSDIMIHYYCQLPYEYRGCFTLKAIELATANKNLYRNLSGYTQAYNFCSDSSTTSNDQNITLSKNIFQPWIASSPSRGQVFQYIMYSVRTSAFDQADQDEVINTFYDVKSSAECSQNQPKRPKRRSGQSPSGDCGTKFASTPGTTSTSTSTSSSPGNSSTGTVTNTPGYNFAGTNWYVSSDADCNNFCASRGGYDPTGKMNLIVNDSDRKKCADVVSKLAPPLRKKSVNNLSRCNYGCGFYSDRGETFLDSCQNDFPTPNVVFGPRQNRLCTCKQ